MIDLENFQKNVAQCRKKPKGETFWSRLYFWKHKKICGLVQESNPRSPASQKISRTNEQKIVNKWNFRVRLSAEKEKKLPTVIAGLFSLREKAPTKNSHCNSRALSTRKLDTRRKQVNKETGTHTDCFGTFESSKKSKDLFNLV